MTGLDELGIVNTGGVKIEPFAIWPPEMRFHQEGVLDAVVVAYNEPETSEVIPVGRVVTAPYLQTMYYEGNYEAETHEVKGIVGDATIYSLVNLAMYRRLAEPVRSYSTELMIKRLRNMQDEATRLVLAYFGLEIERPGLLKRLGSVARRNN